MNVLVFIMQDFKLIITTCLSKVPHLVVLAFGSMKDPRSLFLIPPRLFLTVKSQL